MPCHSKKEQFTLLGSISNYHHHLYPSQKTSNLIKQDHVTYSEHLLSNQSQIVDEGQYSVRKYVPTSPRNRIMYFTCYNQDKERDKLPELHHLIKFLLFCDMPGEHINTFHVNLIQRAGHQEVNLWPEEELIPDSTLTCMHCRFYRDYLLNAYQHACNGDTPLSRPMSMVKDSLEEMGNEVQLVGNVILPTATKFSVKGFESYSILNVSFCHGKCFVICTDGICSAHMKNKRNINRDEVKNGKHINNIKCSHITTFFNNLNYVCSFFPGYFNQEEQIAEGRNGIEYEDTTEEQNYEDTNVGSAVSGHFNTHTGLWEYKSLSQHKPKDMYDPMLVNNTQRRNDFIRSANLDSTTGLYSYLILSPKHLDMRGRNKICRVVFTWKGGNTQLLVNIYWIVLQIKVLNCKTSQKVCLFCGF